MERRIAITADNIVSALGFTTADNMRAVRQGRSGLRFHRARPGEGIEDYTAAAVDDALLAQALEERGIDGGKYTRFESLAILSADSACEGMDLSDAGTLIVLSTTKGNVGLLEDGRRDRPGSEYLWRSAQALAAYFNNPNAPVVVSSACISGVAAQVAAARWLMGGAYRRVVVTGADVLSRFVISGFQSFKALSAVACRPFDSDRQGLNLGEAAATVVLEAVETPEPGQITLEAWALTNDANHISGPSRTGEGLLLALNRVMQGVGADELAAVNAHGTATPYNDEMEAIALARAALSEVPVNSLKGYFGHTLGAAGVLETIVCAHSLREGVVPKSVGYSQSGVSRPLNVAAELLRSDLKQCVKCASGFGGANAAIRLKMWE